VFLKSSRYYGLKTVESPAADGRSVRAVALRRLPAADGAATVVKDNDSLDVMAYQLYRNPTMYWHIADANTELEAGDLVKKAGRVIRVPVK
jgi:hypothetical protein